MNDKDEGSLSLKRGLLSIADLAAQEILCLIEGAVGMKQGGGDARVRSSTTVGLLFEKPSLRTRVSFELAIRQLGGQAIYLSPEEVGLGKREPVGDVARVLSRYLQGIVARTFSHQTLRLLADNASVPVVNALSDAEHPCQALGDLLTIYERKGKLEGLNLAFVGDGNNVASSLLLAASLVGMNFRIASPPKYELGSGVLQTALGFAEESGSTITCVSDPAAAVDGVDIVYTDVWVSMGQEAQAKSRRVDFADYQVNAKLLSCAKKDALFMHPLPAHHGEEIAENILDHPKSVVFDQAENRLHIQKAVLAELLRDV